MTKTTPSKTDVWENVPSVRLQTFADVNDRGLEAELEIDAPVEAVWHALTDGEGGMIWMSCWRKSDAQLGEVETRWQGMLDGLF